MVSRSDLQPDQITKVSVKLRSKGVKNPDREKGLFYLNGFTTEALKLNAAVRL